MAALSTMASGGLIPQARHGGNGVEGLAFPGSKFEGTGLENEQIGHIQVAFKGGKEERNGLSTLDTGEEKGPPAPEFLLSERCTDS
jgi:hypothetical protein